MVIAQSILPTLIGSFGGSVAALVMLWIKTSYDDSRKRKRILKCLHYELDYNINLLSQYREKVAKCREAVSAGIRDTYLSIDYGFIARHFSVMFYREGLILDYLHVEDVKRWNDFLSMLGEGSEAYVVDTVQKWRDGREAKEQTFKALDHEENQIKYGVELCEYLKKKIRS